MTPHLGDPLRNRANLLIAALLCLTVLAIGAIVIQSRPAPVTPPESDAITYDPGRDTRPRLAVVGDSISQGDSPAFSRGDTGPRTWVHHLDASALRFVGGSVKGGMTSKQILAANPNDTRADLVVYMLGTNDIRSGITAPQLVDNIAEHHKQSTLQSSATVVVTAIGPIPGLDSDRIRDWNADVKKQSQQERFIFIDPWTDLATPDYQWKKKTYTFDGLHPSTVGAKAQGKTMTRLLTKVTADSRTAAR